MSFFAQILILINDSSKRSEEAIGNLAMLADGAEDKRRTRSRLAGRQGKLAAKLCVFVIFARVRCAPFTLVV